MIISGTRTTHSINHLNHQNENRKDDEEKLASAKRINGAADDSAGLQIASRLTTEINESAQLNINAQDQINSNQVQEGGLAAIRDGLLRANELAIQSASPLTSTNAIQGELTQITEQINTIAAEVLGDANFLSGIDASDPGATQDAIASAFGSIDEVAATLGAENNALTSQNTTYETSTTKVSASRSRIEDTDFASSSVQQQNQALIQTAIINKKDDEARKGLLVNQLV